MNRQSLTSQREKIDGLADRLKLFINLVTEIANLQNMVYELLLKRGKDLNSSIEKRIVASDKLDVKTNHYYLIDNGKLVLLLETATPEVLDAIVVKQPKKEIAPDRIKKNNQLKTNSNLQMCDASLEFRPI